MTIDAPPETRDAVAGPATRRRGGLFRVWATPNLEVTPVLAGVVAVLWFGLSFRQAAAACLLGGGLGAVAHGVLSARGRASVPGRAAFGRRGIALPAGLTALSGGVGWFAVRCVTGALALTALTGVPAELTLLLTAAAALALGLTRTVVLQAFQRAGFPVLAVLLGAGAIPVLLDAHPGAVGAGGGFGGLTLTAAAAFGCTAAWTPYAADHARYLPPDAGRVATGVAAGLGVGTSVLLMVVGAASATTGTGVTGDPVGDLTGPMPGVLADLVLLAFALGAVSAAAVHVHSGAISLPTTGIPVTRRQATAGLGLLGLGLAGAGLDDAAHGAETLLLVVAAWIAPWLGILLADRLLRRGPAPEQELAGPIALVVALAVSLGLFSTQERYIGLVPGRWPGSGDLTPLVGLLLAAALYALLAGPGLRRRGSGA